MGQTPDEIRTDIEQTRDRMTETVEAMAYRADVKTRAKESIFGKKEKAMQASEGVVGKARGTVQRLTAPLPPPRDAASSVSESVSDAASTVSSTAADAASSVADAGASVAGRVGEAMPDREQMREVISVAQSNPVGLVLGAAAVGFLIGLAAPTTRTEDEKLGPISDQIKEQASDVGQEALEHGKQVAQAAAETAVQTAKEQGKEHADELSSSLQEKARDVRQST
jgi:hypothetical protein